MEDLILEQPATSTGNLVSRREEKRYKRYKKYAKTLPTNASARSASDLSNKLMNMISETVKSTGEKP